MSDILAVYAWVDPMTGYCQGMSDLLSPFIVLFEDDADAFWCFESLLRRIRPNFQMEGPIGVMKQLEALERILQLTGLQLFKHLAQIGAESLLFSFRMLAFVVVLFALIRKRARARIRVLGVGVLVFGLLCVSPRYGLHSLEGFLSALVKMACHKFGGRRVNPGRRTYVMAYQLQ
jgi:hypothetical protein